MKQGQLNHPMISVACDKQAGRSPPDLLLQASADSPMLQHWLRVECITKNPQRTLAPLGFS